MKSRWIKTIPILLTLCLLSFAGCSKPKVVTVERAITAKGCPAPILREHKDLLVENIRLKADLKACQAKP